MNHSTRVCVHTWQVESAGHRVVYCSLRAGHAHEHRTATHADGKVYTSPNMARLEDEFCGEAAS